MILINGAKGKVGRSLMKHWDRLNPFPRDVDNMTAPLDGLPVNTFVHLALKQMDMTRENDCERSLSILFDTLDQCNQFPLKRLIFTSSALAEPDRYAVEHPWTWYGAAKAASEAILRCYAAERGIAVIVLRIGLYEPDRGVLDRPDWERRLAINEPNLMAWFDAAYEVDKPGFYLWDSFGGAH